jgi:hypothetical protein
MNALIRIEHSQKNEPLVDFLNAIVDAQLIHYASDLYPELEMPDEESFNQSLNRAQQVCSTLNLPVHEHFKRIYRTSKNHVYCDYKLSHTAYILVSINGDVSRKKVAQIQMELVQSLIVKH